MLSSKKFTYFLLLWLAGSISALSLGLYNQLNAKEDSDDVSVSNECKDMPPGGATFLPEFKNATLQLDENNQVLIKWKHQTGTWGKFCSKKKFSNAYIVDVAPIAAGGKCNAVKNNQYKVVFKSTGGKDTEFGSFQDPFVTRGNKISTTDYKLEAGTFCMRITRTSAKLSSGPSNPIVINFTK